MVTYSVFLGIEFLVLIGGLVASVRLVFDIRTGNNPLPICGRIRGVLRVLRFIVQVHYVERQNVETQILI
jgi:hypothetical protein